MCVYLQSLQQFLCKRPDLKVVLKGVRVGGTRVRVGIALVLKCAHSQVIDLLTLAGVQYTLVHGVMVWLSCFYYKVKQFDMHVCTMDCNYKFLVYVLK